MKKTIDKKIIKIREGLMGQSGVCQSLNNIESPGQDYQTGQTRPRHSEMTLFTS